MCLTNFFFYFKKKKKFSTKNTSSNTIVYALFRLLASSLQGLVFSLLFLLRNKNNFCVLSVNFYSLKIFLQKNTSSITINPAWYNFWLPPPLQEVSLFFSKICREVMFPHSFLLCSPPPPPLSSPTCYYTVGHDFPDSDQSRRGRGGGSAKSISLFYFSPEINFAYIAFSILFINKILQF